MAEAERTERTRQTPRTPRRLSGAQAAVRAAEQLVELTGRAFEGIVGLGGDDDGWTVQIEVLELRRIPDTTDLMAVYEVDLTRTGDLIGYRRVDRYLRGSAAEDRG